MERGKFKVIEIFPLGNQSSCPFSFLQYPPVFLDYHMDAIHWSPSPIEPHRRSPDPTTEVSQLEQKLLPRSYLPGQPYHRILGYGMMQPWLTSSTATGATACRWHHADMQIASCAAMAVHTTTTPPKKAKGYKLQPLRKLTKINVFGPAPTLP